MQRVAGLALGLFLGMTLQNPGRAQDPSIQDKKIQDGKKELEKLQGTWELVEVIHSGKVVPKEALAGGRVVIQGDQMTLSENANDAEPRKFRIVLKPDLNPKGIDTITLNRDNDQTSPGIYRLEGDTLKICSPNVKEIKERPTEFKSGEGSRLVILTMKRVKK